MSPRAAARAAKMLVLSLLLFTASWASWGLRGGSSSPGSPSLAARSFLLAAETPSQVAPSHPSPSTEAAPCESLLKDGDPSRGHSSSFCGWAVSLSITGVVLTFASRKRRARVRGAWRRAMNAVARLRYPEPSSPSSYAAALLNPPTLDFLCRSQRWAEDIEDSDDEFKRNVDGMAIQKTRSLPAKMVGAAGFSPISDSDEERMSFSSRHHMGPHQRAPTLLQRRQAQTRKGWTAEPSTKSVDLDELHSSIPSVQDLRRIYIVQVAQAESTQGAVIAAIKQLNTLKYGRCKVHFQDGDAKQFYDMLSNYGTKPVSAQSFAVELRQLLSALASCDQLSLPQLRSIMATAFDRFDFNEDGKLSIDEFSSALLSFNIELGAAETETLLRFLALAPAVCEETPVLEKEDLTKAESPELTLEDKVCAACGGVKDQLQSSTGWNTAVKIAEKVGHCLQQPGSPRSQAKRLMDLGHKELVSATEISLTLAGLTMVVLHHSQIHPDAAVFEQISDALDDFVGAVRDLFQSMPIGPALSGALGLAKTQKDSVALDVDEALLYARYFLPQGCSQSLFHKLLTMAGCHWGSVSAGQRLQGDGELRILVRGKAVRKRGEDKEDLLPGAFLNACCEDQVVALEDLTYMAWNTEKLNACMESVKDAGLKQLAERMLEDAAGVCHDTQVPVCPEEDWFAPVGEALESQAKRRGLVTSSLCPEGFCRILSKPNMSFREKLDQVHAWILSSKHEICDSLEAAGDLAALGSLLVALYNHSATLSPENFPQLAPLLILLADVISKKRSSQYDETAND